jgi:hypothetical protein
VGAVVQLDHLRARRQLLAGETDARTQHDPHHGEALGGIRAHDPARIVIVLIDAPAALGGQVQEPQHVAGGQGCDEGFLRIDRRRHRHGGTHHQRGCGSWHLDAAVEVPGVAAAVAFVGEGRVAPFPVNASQVLVYCHGRIVR